MASCFFRLVLAPPGYIPRQKDLEKSAKGAANRDVRADIFVCQPGGFPRWCQTCQVVKPDRAHHSRDSGRCVYKMGIHPFAISVLITDHFCPWVGGMVGFTRYKFFLQFVTYTALFCIFIVASVVPVPSPLFRLRVDVGAESKL